MVIAGFLPSAVSLWRRQTLQVLLCGPGLGWLTKTETREQLQKTAKVITRYTKITPWKICFSIQYIYSTQKSKYFKITICIWKFNAIFFHSVMFLLFICQISRVFFVDRVIWDGYRRLRHRQNRLNETSSGKNCYWNSPLFRKFIQLNETDWGLNFWRYPTPFLVRIAIFLWSALPEP